MSLDLATLSVLVLAGGQGRRLGGGKPSTRLGAQTLLDRALTTARGLSADVLVLPRDRVLEPLPADVRVIADRADLEGPLAGLSAGLQAARRPWSLLLPCDMPFARPDVVERLLRRAEAGHADAVVVHDLDGLQPFHGLYHRRMATRLEAYLATGRRSLRGLLEAIATEAIDVESLRDLDPELRFLDDVDTPRDLAAAQASLAS